MAGKSIDEIKLGDRAKFLAPVRIGDTIKSEVEVVDMLGKK